MEAWPLFHQVDIGDRQGPQSPWAPALCRVTFQLQVGMEVSAASVVAVVLEATVVVTPFSSCSRVQEREFREKGAL